MADRTTNPDAAPWHHWPVAVAAVVFYGLAALDYALAKLGIAAYLANFSAEQQEFVRTLPSWLSLVWASGVWGGLAGALLLYRRNRYSVLLLLVGAGVLAFLTFWLSLFTRPTIFGMAGFTGFYVMLGTAAIAALIYLYARWERTERKLA